MDWLALAREIIVLVVSGGIGGALVSAWANRRKTDAEAENAEADAETKRTHVFQSLVDNLRSELATVRGEVTDLRAKQTANIGRITDLESKNGDWERNCKHMQSQIAELQAERQEWKDGIDMLINQLIELEIKPRWTRKGTSPL